MSQVALTLPVDKARALVAAAGLGQDVLQGNEEVSVVQRQDEREDASLDLSLRESKCTVRTPSSPPRVELFS